MLQENSNLQRTMSIRFQLRREKKTRSQFFSSDQKFSWNLHNVGGNRSINKTIRDRLKGYDFQTIEIKTILRGEFVEGLTRIEIRRDA